MGHLEVNCKFLIKYLSVYGAAAVCLSLLTLVLGSEPQFLLFCPLKMSLYLPIITAIYQMLRGVPDRSCVVRYRESH